MFPINMVKIPPSCQNICPCLVQNQQKKLSHFSTITDQTNDGAKSGTDLNPVESSLSLL